MGTSTCQIIDLEGATVTLTLNEESPNESASPPPSSLGTTRKRAIVEHPIPCLDRDVGQDMGAYSNEYVMEGISQSDIRDALDAFFQLGQFTEAHPGGRFRVTLTPSGWGYPAFDKSGLVMKNYSWRYVGGLKRWFRYSITFKEFQGQT